MEGFSNITQLYCLCFMLLHSWLSFVMGVSYSEKQATVGGNVILPCRVDFGGVLPTVMWLDTEGSPLTHNERLLTTDDRYSIDHPYQSEWNLRISGVRAEDGGNFSCQIKTSPVTMKYVNLVIVSAPQMVSSSEDVELETESDITLHCEASGTPTPSINWYRYSNVLDKEDLGVADNLLRLFNVTRHGAATYECRASNGVPPEVSALIRVDVMFGPIVTLPHQYISQEEGRDTLLQCTTTVNPYDDIHWEYGGMVIEESDKHHLETREIGHYNKSLLLTISKLTREDFGAYVCVAENNFGSDRATMELKEWQSGHIRLVSPPKDAISSEGLDVVMNCEVEQMGHKDSIAWWKYNYNGGFVRIFESHPPTDSGRTPTHLNTDKYDILGHYNLLVKNVTLADGGEYMCELVGRSNHSAFITVVDMLVCKQASNVTVISGGALATFSCGMQFSGPIQLWHAVWRRENKTLSSIDEDMGDYIQRTVSFPAFASDSGVYTCVISNKEPPYYGQCETSIEVLDEVFVPSPVCKYESLNISPTDLNLILAGALGGVSLLFIFTVMGICCHFKKKIRKIRSPESSPIKMNGDQNLETSHLTATDANEHEV